MISKLFPSNYYLRSFFWSFLSKFLVAASSFVSIPLMITYFGKENYGILSLAISLNAYMYIFDMGLNIGAIKFYSQWRNSGLDDKIHNVAQTSISFYGLIGFFNTAVLFLCIFISKWIFNLTAEENILFQQCLFILAFFPLFSWISSVFSQLLIAYEKISLIQIIIMVRALLEFVAILVTLYFKLSLLSYFILYMCGHVSVIIIG